MKKEKYILLEKISTKLSGKIEITYEIFKRSLWFFYFPLQYDVVKSTNFDYISLKEFFPGFKPRHQFTNISEAKEVLNSLRALNQEGCIDVFPVIPKEIHGERIVWANCRELWKERYSELYMYRAYKIFKTAFQAFKDSKTIDVKIQEITDNDEKL